MALKQLAAKTLLAAEGLLRPRSRIQPSGARTVLVLEYMLPLGSCVHMTPVFEALRQRPHTTVIVATRGLALDLLRHSPFIDHLLETPDPLRDLLAGRASLRRQLRQHNLQPDCALTGAADQRTRIALLAALACKGWRGGYTVQPALYQRPLTVDRSVSLIANNLRLAGLLGATPGLLEPRIFFDADAAAHARALLTPMRQNERPLLAVVTQNSGGQRTGWHTARWIETLRFAQQTLGYEVAYIGTTADAAPIQALAEHAGGTSLAGRTSVPQLAALLALSDLVLSLDTGTMHVARALATPMVVLGPSWQKPIEWLPLGKPQVRILRGQDRDDIPPGYQLDEISAEAAQAALRELATLYPPSAFEREARLQAGLSNIDLLRS